VAAIDQAARERPAPAADVDDPRRAIRASRPSTMLGMRLSPSMARRADAMAAEYSHHLGRGASCDAVEADIVDVREIGGIQRTYYRSVWLDPTWLFLSLVPGGIGFVLFVYGKKQQRWTIVVFGVAFMVYPYFTPGVVGLIAGTVVLSALLWWAIRMGW